ncbi:hypothetical protein KI387_044178 [Taxus chinensis]|uniref:Uncharacterized protein n=1 Tax=Taxus chinensis TaxID=29808 RepID=A0AA38C6C1_TAXCH|nr:hypothetical protein KI387_044178 [Taxus chinensis]
MGNCVYRFHKTHHSLEKDTAHSREDAKLPDSVILHVQGDGHDDLDSDTVWEKRLPENYQQILTKMVSPANFSSKKQIYNSLCESFLIENGTKRIWLDKSTGKIGCMLSAKALDITWGNDTRYWRWVSRDDSKFEQVAELVLVWWFEVWRRIECTLLSPNTQYIVSFVVKIDKTEVPSYPSPFVFSLKTPNGDLIESARFLDDLEKPVEKHGGLKMTPVTYGENGWIEFVVGEFSLEDDEDNDDTKDIDVSMKNTSSCIKSGIFIDGVKIVPKKLSANE